MEPKPTVAGAHDSDGISIEDDELYTAGYTDGYTAGYTDGYTDDEYTGAYDSIDLSDDDYDIAGDYPENGEYTGGYTGAYTPSKLGGMIDIVNNAYEDMGMHSAVVFGGPTRKTVKKRSSAVASHVEPSDQNRPKSASTVSADVRRMFSPSKQGGGENPPPETNSTETNSIQQLLNDLAQDADDTQSSLPPTESSPVLGSFELDPPEEFSRDLLSGDIWGIIEGSGAGDDAIDTEYTDAQDDENAAAGFSILEDIAD
jgi:hypothetical protein